MSKPIPEQYPGNYQRYIDLVPQEDILDALEQNMSRVTDFFHGINEAEISYVYAPGKWTIPAILLHITDTERIFAYRALRISRGDTTPLESFNEKEFMAHVDMADRYMPDLITEFRTVRAATLSLFRSYDAAALERQGTASGNATNVVSIGFFIPGHANHHINVISERYLGKIEEKKITNL